MRLKLHPAFVARIRRACLATVIIAAGTDLAGQNRAADNLAARQDVSGLLDRATAYAERFLRDFGSVVAEERYEQRVGPVPGAIVPASARARTVLRSDFLLVDSPEARWLAFRDVFERDGKPVRDRRARLTALFLTEDRNALERARAIMNESARFNIGNVDRNINLPTLALTFLTARVRSRFAFELGKRDGRIVEIEYKEKSRPTVVESGRRGDLPVAGRFWIDEADGTVVRSELRAIDDQVEAHVTVTYQHDPELQLWAPSHMQERYQRRNSALEIRGDATYSRFRRFRVNASVTFERSEERSARPEPK